MILRANLLLESFEKVRLTVSQSEPWARLAKPVIDIAKTNEKPALEETLISSYQWDYCGFPSKLASNMGTQSSR